MKVLNLFVKIPLYAGIYFVTLISSYLVSVVITAVVLAVICAIWSFIQPLPELLSARYGEILLLSSIPACIVFFIYTVIRAHPKKTKEEKQE